MKKLLFGTALAVVALLSACNNGRIHSSLKTDVDTVSYEIGLANTGGIENYFLQMGIDSAHVKEFIKGLRDGAMAADNEDRRAYYLGVQAGLQIKEQLIPAMEDRMFAGDSTQSISLKNFLAGFTAGINKKSALKIDGKIIDPQMAGEDANQRMQKIGETFLEKKYGAKKAAAADFMKKVAKQEGVKPLGEGVYYKVLTEGTGAKPAKTDVVMVDFEGRLIDGTVFDSSAKGPSSEPVSMPLTGIIKGLQVALPQMPIGSEWEIYIPYELGYGAQGTGPIEPFSPLIFKIKLHGVKEKKSPAEGAQMPLDIKPIK